MIQKTKKYPHSPTQVKAVCHEFKNHSIMLKTSGKERSAVFYGKMNSAEMKKICEFIEANFSIHKEDY